MIRQAATIGIILMATMPAWAGSSSGGVPRKYQFQSCAPGIACWPLGDEAPVYDHLPTWNGIEPPIYHHGECPHVGVIALRGRLYRTCY